MTQIEDLQGYRDGLARGELCGQRCDACGEHQWPPRPACVHCRSFDLRWVPLPESADLFTWTVVARTRLAGFEDKVPYAVGVLEFQDPKLRMVGRLDADPDRLEVGDRFSWTVEPSVDGSAQPVWRPVAVEVTA
jgi:uncharacterized OB-fold protein